MPTRRGARPAGLLVGLLALLLVSTGVQAKKTPSAAARTQDVVAVIVIPKNNPDPTLLDALRAQLVSAGRTRSDLRILSGDLLSRALGLSPVQAIGQCGSDLKCIAKLGKRSRAGRVLLAMVTPADSGLAIKCLVVGTDSAKIEQKAAFQVASVAQMESALGLQLASLLPPPAETGAAGAAVASVAHEQPAPTPVASTPLPAAIMNAPSPAPAAASTKPAHPPNPEAVIIHATPAAGRTEGSAPPEIAADNTRAAAPSSHLWRYAGGGLAGVGLAAIGVGAFLGLQARSDFGNIKHGVGGTTQLDAIKQTANSNDLARNADLLFATGGAAAVVGIGVFLVDVLVLGKPAQTPTLGVGPNGPGVSLWWRF